MKINDLMSINKLDIKNTGNLLKNIDIGDIVRVQVTGISSKILSLRLPDGSNINASSQIPLQVNIGDFLDLSLKSKKGEQVFVEILTDDKIKTDIKDGALTKSEQILDNIKGIKENSETLQHNNRFYNIYNIPIQINGYNTHADLYIFKDKSYKKKIDPSNATVFVSLDTSNLGLVEALINIFDKNIECHFQAGSKETLSFIKNNITPLYGLLDAYGYNLVNISYKNVGNKTQLEDLNRIRDEKVRKYSFDTRV